MRSTKTDKASGRGGKTAIGMGVSKASKVGEVRPKAAWVDVTSTASRYALTDVEVLMRKRAFVSPHNMFNFDGVKGSSGRPSRLSRALKPKPTSGRNLHEKHPGSRQKLAQNIPVIGVKHMQADALDVLDQSFTNEANEAFLTDLQDDDLADLADLKYSLANTLPLKYGSNGYGKAKKQYPMNGKKKKKETRASERSSPAERSLFAEGSLSEAQLEEMYAQICSLQSELRHYEQIIGKRSALDDDEEMVFPASFAALMSQGKIGALGVIFQSMSSLVESSLTSLLEGEVRHQIAPMVPNSIAPVVPNSVAPMAPNITPVVPNITPMAPMAPSSIAPVVPIIAPKLPIVSSPIRLSPSTSERSYMSADVRDRNDRSDGSYLYISADSSPTTPLSDTRSNFNPVNMENPLYDSQDDSVTSPFALIRESTPTSDGRGFPSPTSDARGSLIAASPTDWLLASLGNFGALGALGTVGTPLHSTATPTVRVGGSPPSVGFGSAFNAVNHDKPHLFKLQANLFPSPPTSTTPTTPITPISHSSTDSAAHETKTSGVNETHFMASTPITTSHGYTSVTHGFNAFNDAESSYVSSAANERHDFPNHVSTSISSDAIAINRGEKELTAGSTPTAYARIPASIYGIAYGTKDQSVGHEMHSGYIGHPVDGTISPSLTSSGSSIYVTSAAKESRVLGHEKHSAHSDTSFIAHATSTSAATAANKDVYGGITGYAANTAQDGRSIARNATHNSQSGFNGTNPSPSSVLARFPSPEANAEWGEKKGGRAPMPAQQPSHPFGDRKIRSAIVSDKSDRSGDRRVSFHM